MAKKKQQGLMIGGHAWKAFLEKRISARTCILIAQLDRECNHYSTRKGLERGPTHGMEPHYYRWSYLRHILGCNDTRSVTKSLEEGLDARLIDKCVCPNRHGIKLHVPDRTAEDFEDTTFYILPEVLNLFESRKKQITPVEMFLLNIIRQVEHTKQVCCQKNKLFGERLNLKIHHIKKLLRSLEEKRAIKRKVVQGDELKRKCCGIKNANPTRYYHIMRSVFTRGTSRAEHV